ncbi:MAG: hypothetical protein JWO78_2086 [Micavibrio sp.]|nr:hypothetical protein [Micavibrio sp.]
MSFLSRAFEKMFLSPEKLQLKAAFLQATQAVRSHDTPTLKAVLGNTKFDQDKNLSLLVGAISIDNVEGFETILDGTGTSVKNVLTLHNYLPLATQSLDTPMLPYAISRGSEKISRFLAGHPDTDPEARACMSYFNACVCPSTGTVYAHSTTVRLRKAQSLAEKMGMPGVAEIIRARTEAVKIPFASRN